MYFVLGGSEEPRRWIGKKPFVKGVKWWNGAKITTQVPTPLEFKLKPYVDSSPDDAQFMPAFLPAKPPLFRDDLIEALRDFGVTNFDTYSVELIDPDNDRAYTNYKAINIIGLVAAADMDKSDATVYDNIPLIDVDFDNLVIDESKTHGILMFRLAESSNAVLIHERLKDFLISKGFGKDMRFSNPKDVAI